MLIFLMECDDMGVKSICISMIVGFVVLFTWSNSSAYNIQTDSIGKQFVKPTTTGGHEEITEYSVKQLDYSDMPGLAEKLNSALPILLESVAAEDTPWMKAATHFYDPTTGAGFFGTLLESAKFSALSYYSIAWDEYKLGFKNRAWDRLGHTLHLLQDMSVPSHVHAAPHMYQAVIGEG